MNHRIHIQKGFIQQVKALFYRKSAFCPKMMPHIKGNVIHTQNMSNVFESSML